jgi:hypothetical protein
MTLQQPFSVSVVKAQAVLPIVVVGTTSGPSFAAAAHAVQLGENRATLWIGSHQHFSGPEEVL